MFVLVDGENVVNDGIKDLGHKLIMMDQAIRKTTPKEFNENNDEINAILKEIAVERRNVERKETEEDCFQRLKNDCKSFAQIYRERNGIHSCLIYYHIIVFCT